MHKVSVPYIYQLRAREKMLNKPVQLELDFGTSPTTELRV